MFNSSNRMFKLSITWQNETKAKTKDHQGHIQVLTSVIIVKFTMFIDEPLKRESKTTKLQMMQGRLD